MRAGRLVELLLLLQNRGRMTAPQLARQLEVSVRTVVRDIESLSGAGVPVRAIRGREGGYELMEGYRTELAGPGRLVELLLLLQNRGRMTAPQLARELEVSVRTVVRDIESLSGAGVPVRAIRGREGGYELMEGYRTQLAGPGQWGPDRRGPTAPKRAQVRISQEGRRLAAVMNLLQPIRVRRNVEPDEHGWQEASFRLWSVEAAARDILALGPEVEVLGPPPLRETVADMARATAARYA